MAARSKRTQGFSLFHLSLLALVLVVGFFLLNSKSSKVDNKTAEETAKPTTQNTTNAVAQGASSGPVGRNALKAYAGPGVGEVTLEWHRYFLDGENFTIHYGTSSGNYPFAATRIGYISTYTIKNLTPGTKYYFTVEGIRTGDVSAGSDGEVSVVAPGTAVEVVINGPVGRNLLVAKTGSKKGTVDLAWQRFFNDTQLFSVVYGTIPGKFTYGALNAVDTIPTDKGTYTYTVSGLTSGKRYYFALVPQRNGQGIYTSSEVSAVAR